MAIKQLVLSKKIEQRKSALAALLVKDAEYQTRNAELEKALEEANNDEEVNTVEEAAGELEAERAEHDAEKSRLEGEIQALEGELEQLNSNEPEVNPKAAEPTQRSHNQTGGEVRMRGNKHETRSQMLERLNQSEVKEFYEKIRSAVKEKRALTGTDIVIPTAVINMIQTRIGDFSKLYGEVTVQTLNGDARVILDGAIPEAIWTEMCDPVQELSSAFDETELDGYKVGGFIPICNAILEDSMIDLADFIEGRLAMAIAKALDKAILTGQTSAKQPVGIVTAVTANLAANVVDSDGTLVNIMSFMGQIDDGEDGQPIGEVIAVMRRSTYYSRIAPQTYLPTADGRLVIQTATSPRLPDGTRVVFSQYAGNDRIIMGDFKKYLLGERAGVKITSSTDVRFIEDQTVFKGTARYDGKPIDESYFLVIDLAPASA